jgi:ferredoxin like protein
MKIEEKIALNSIKHDAKSHIEINKELCRTCEPRICLRACPAELYTIEPESGEVTVDYTGCLECGTCLVICPLKAVAWNYPEPGFGIRYRYG